MYFKDILKFSGKNCITKNKIHNIKDKMAKLGECNGEYIYKKKKPESNKWIIIWIRVIRSKEPVFG